MSSILTAILRSVSGVAKTYDPVATVAVPMPASDPKDDPDVSFDSMMSSPPEIIVHRDMPYVYRRATSSPSKTTGVATWRKEQLRCANPVRIINESAMPIPSQHGPSTLPYARNPSGVDAQVMQDTRLEIGPKEVKLASESTDPAALLFAQRMAEHLAKSASPHENALASNAFRSQMDKSKADPFQPLFKKAIEAAASRPSAADEERVVQDAETYLGMSKADASANWRDKGDEDVMTMDALFEQFAPTTPPSVNLNSDKGTTTTPLAEDKGQPFEERSDNAGATPSRRRRKPTRSGKPIDKPSKKSVREIAPSEPKNTPVSKATLSGKPRRSLRL